MELVVNYFLLKKILELSLTFQFPENISIFLMQIPIENDKTIFYHRIGLIMFQTDPPEVSPSHDLIIW